MTLSWRATLALRDAEHIYAHILEQREMEEQFVLNRLAELGDDADLCHALLTSPRYTEYRHLLDEKLEGSAILERSFHQGTPEDGYFDWCERLNEIDCALRLLDPAGALKGLEWQVLQIQSAMSELGFDMPRQTVIEDYFHVESSTTDEDSTIDEDEE
ncbi:hypothetical protein KC332_g4631 [Hortaea werneckii]|nr:hypothetical protein KC358_g7636 [Hortaea werneckii]KAI6829751.1 hypothetical protein KC350_g7768 [Hortaea werneckii]KAI6939066.1 hypothetical protein KC341_g4444 [Hortaea werneckii]KAI6941637.1 hypothetical protein KC348_g4669 [Hortaea werneckii]KAI6975072.1 hypothetical protein KC321_g4765 [Hortaea werneckii]